MTKPGDHRRPAGRRLPNVVGLASLVGALLAVFGVGAVLLPPNFGGYSSSGSAAPAADGTVPGVGAFGSLASAADRRLAPKPTATTKAPTAAPTRTPTTKRTRAATATRPAGGATSGPQAEVVALVNKERAGAGCGAVVANAKLTRAAQAHSQDQADHNTMSHTGSDGSTPWDRSERAGYDQAIGENVAAGYRTPADVMNGWMHSEGHRANILNCAARAIGVGRAAAGNGTLYWTQLFGSV